MIYNTRNGSNDRAESQKEKRSVLMLMQGRKVKLDCHQCNVAIYILSKQIQIKCGHYKKLGYVKVPCHGSKTSLHAV